MLPYLILLSVLLLLAFWEAVAPKRSPAPIFFAAAAVILFVGFRFETGSDWVEYEWLFNSTQPFFSNVPVWYVAQLVVEPGFSFLVTTLVTLGLPFQSLLFITALFSVGVLALFAYRYSERPVVVLLWYCGFALLIGQMAALRQVAAYGFLFLAFMAFDRRKVVSSAVWAFLAVSMHVFSIVLLPTIYIRVKPPRTAVILGLCTAGLGLIFVGVNVFELAIAPLTQLLGGIVGVKLESYGNVGAAAVSSTSLVLFAWHALVLKLLNGREDQFYRDPIIKFAIYTTIWCLIAHSFLATEPAVWNRVMLFAMPVEMIALLRCYYGALRIPLWNAAIPIGVWFTASASIGYGLSQENALPYVPYRSLVHVWVTGDEGDGRLRYAIEQRRLERRLIEGQR